jgi:glucokinase
MDIIGVDIGGSKIEAALIRGKKVSKVYSCPTPAGESKENVVKAVGDAIDKVITRSIAGIGIGVPGLVDLESNEVLDVMNIPSWDCVPLKKLLEDRFRKVVYINNDANCFALGEKHFGKGGPYTNFVGVTIGTGLGAGIIINNHLYSGRYCGAGEIGPVCYRDRTLETYASGQFFRERRLVGTAVAAEAGKGDPEAVRLFHELGEHLGRAIANLLFILAPEAIILGGSVTGSYPLFEAGMRSVLKSEFPYQRLYDSLKIEISDLKNSSVLGASSLVIDAGH